MGEITSIQPFWKKEERPNMRLQWTRQLAAKNHAAVVVPSLRRQICEIGIKLSK
jgi:hypothetical protein